MKRILLILMIIAIIGIMALPAMAWDGYPETPLSNEYDSSFIYQVILSKGNNTMLVVSQTKFYKEGDMLSEDRIRTSSTIHVLNYINEDWVYSGSLVSSQGVYFDEIIQSTHNIYMDETLTSVFFFGYPENSYAEGPDPTPTPFPDEPPDTWYQSILDWVIDSLGGIFEGLATPFQNIAQGINNIFQLFNPENQQNIFRILFVPRPEFLQANITVLYGVIEEKIPLLNDLIMIVKGMAENLINAEVNTPPEFKINLPAKWGGFEAKIIDFSMYVPYRFFIMNIIRAIAWYFFIKRLLRRMPTIIY